MRAILVAHLVGMVGLLGACSATDLAATVPAEASPAEAQLGQLAPDFTLKDLDGKEHKLSSFRGKTVVLEWFNPGCPYVRHAHGEGGVLSTFPAEAAGQGVVWLAVNSGTAGQQGSGAEVNKKAAAGWKMSYPVLLDDTAAVGRLYGAKTTPHMYVIDPAGKLVYRGAIDNRPMGEGQGTAVNYVAKALADLGAGRAVATADTKPYGCSVKY